MAKSSSDSQSPKPLQGGALVALTIGVALATFMEVLDISIVNVSVFTIAGDLGVSQTEGTMAISAYTLASAIMQPLTGWIARRLGEVRTFSLSIMLFVVFSMLCGFATSMNMLIVFRLLQGLVSGPMVPLSQTLLLNNYPKAKRPLALALWAMTVVVAPGFGPILGGWITDNYKWSWIFFINVPVGLFALTVTYILLRKRESKKVKVPIDALGLFLLAAGVGCLQFMLDKGNDYDWFASNIILILAVIAVVCLTFLVPWELMRKDPVVDLSLFKGRNFAVGTTCLTLGMFAFFGGSVVLPQYVQQVLGYTATWAGLVIAPSSVLAIVLSPLVGIYATRFDLRLVNCLAYVIFGIASFWIANLSTTSAYLNMALPRMLMGAGIALFFVPVNQIILAGLPETRVASAAGLSNFFRTIAQSVATAVSVTLYDHRTIYHHAILTQNVQPGATMTTEYLNKVHELGLQGKSAYAALNRTIDLQASTLAINDVFWVFGMIFGVVFLITWLAKPPFDSGGSSAA